MALRCSGLQGADSSGKILGAGDECVGFMLLPYSDGLVYPGSYPVTVTPRRGGGQDPIVVTGPHSYWFDKPCKGGFDVSGAQANEGWLVFTFEGYNDGVSPGRPQRFTVPVQATPTAVPQAVPVGNVGYAVRPGTRGHNFYFTATAGGLINVWGMSASGNWRDGGILGQIDPTQEGIAYRDVLIHAKRVYLRSAGAGNTVEIDADMEIG